MSKETSLYLDLVRLMAAMTVLVSHLSEKRLTDGFLWQVGHFLPGTDAVVVFFVLSGFVIAYVTETRERSARDYIISRATRIYSVAAPALLVIFILHAIGSAIRPALYPIYWNDTIYGSIWQFFCGFTFTNQLWWSHVPIFSNVPYWSLSYEVWYYIVFGLAVFAPSVWRWVAIPAVLVFLGPTIVTALPIWLLGVALWRLVCSLQPGPWFGASLWFGSLLIWAAYNIAKRDGPLISEVIYLGENLRLNDAYIIAALFAVNVYGFQGISAYFTRTLHRWSPMIRWGAGATFSIYLMHYPLLLFLGSIAAWPPGSWQTRLFISSGTILGVLAFAAVTERRKDQWRRAITFLANRIVPAIAMRPDLLGAAQAGAEASPQVDAFFARKVRPAGPLAPPRKP